MDAKAAKDGSDETSDKGKCLLPKVFKDQNHIEEIKGIYVPFWLFDAEVGGGYPLQRDAGSDLERQVITIIPRTSYYSIRFIEAVRIGV